MAPFMTAAAPAIPAITEPKRHAVRSHAAPIDLPSIPIGTPRHPSLVSVPSKTMYDSIGMSGMNQRWPNLVATYMTPGTWSTLP